MNHQKRRPTLKDIEVSLKKGAPLIAYINTTPNSDTFNGHFVVIKGIDNQKRKITINNPGLPPGQLEWSFNEFEKAFYGSNDTSRKMSFLISFKPK
jgi:hypothetical protein